MSINRGTSIKLLTAIAALVVIGVSFIANVKETKTNRAMALDPKVSKLKLLPDFNAEHLYSPSENKNGSWVAMTFDDKGRIITCDQDGYLYRVTTPAIGTADLKSKVNVERLELKIPGDTTKAKIKMGYAHGLLYAFNSLYVMVNHRSDTSMAKGSGLYRLQDTNNDDQFDKITQLKALQTPGGEHGPHSIVLSPDKQSIYVVAGNFTEIPEMNSYRSRPIWQRDNIMPLIKDPNGHDNRVANHGGWIAKINPEGTDWELVSSGYRNPFDIAFNDVGDLFAYDSDMEWDIGMPWYRPTRILHATSGSEYGWREGTEKWSASFTDNLPAVLNVGQGSPTNFISGVNARFPEKFRRSLFSFDWSFGIIYAIQLQPDGSSYKAKAEEFLTGLPLPLTDGIVGPDGALYFLTGGRKLESDLYRVFYKDNTASNDALTSSYPAAVVQARETRRKLEAFHLKPDASAVATSWPYLKNSDRYIRFAARIAVEHQPVAEWQERAIAEKDPIALTQAMVALARSGDASLRNRMFTAMTAVNYGALNEAQQLDLLRAFELTIARMGQPDATVRTKMLAYLDPKYPAASNELNRSISKLLVSLQSNQVVPKTLALINTAKDIDIEKTFSSSSDLILRNPQYGLDIAGMLAKRPPAQQIFYATVLSEAKNGWTPELREKYFKWYYKAFSYQAGNSYIGFISRAKKMALANVPQAQFAHYDKISGNELISANGNTLAGVINPKGPDKTWKMEEALLLLQKDTTNRSFEQGKAMFSAVKCISCHTMRGEGGSVGPDLTQLGTRFSQRDILESIIDPSKVISDQYASTVFTMKDGSSILGRIKNEDKDKYYISQNPFAPQTVRTLLKKDVTRTKISEISIMYPQMINRLGKEELKDLMAYLTSGANKENDIYKSKSK